MLAGVACGIFDSFADSTQKCCHAARVYTPNPENAALYDYYFKRYRAVHDALAPVYHDFREIPH